jgi:DNA-binding NtrC family response regulator
MGTILVVDDDEAILQVTTAMLKKKNHGVFLAQSAEAAKEILAHSAVDLIILDVVLPGLGGMELLIQIRNSHPKIPVIIMSGKVRTNIRPFKNLAQQFGATCILSKPFTAEELYESVDGILKNSCT